jgi:NADPH-dependent curcumin reductase CurA
MTEQANRCYRLRRRPRGAVIEEGDLELVEEVAPTIGPGQALVRTLLLSVDPTNRPWMADVRSYIAPVAIDAVMRGIGIGEVVESRREDMAEGDLVFGFTGWQDYAVADDASNELPFAVLPSPLPAPLSAFLGVLGHTGVTAYLGVEDIGRPQPGETMVVSGAAGAVGSVAGQLGKARGARVVGIAGSDEKCRHVVEDLGFDACVNYKAPDWAERLDAVTPDGIDVDYENVGGAVMDHILGRLNVGARIVLCGMISMYADYGSPAGWEGQFEIVQVLLQRATVGGFIVLDHADRFPEAVGHLAGLIAEGRLTYRETLVDGLENARDALNRLFGGENTGKMVVRVAEPLKAAAPPAAATTVAGT